MHACVCVSNFLCLSIFLGSPVETFIIFVEIDKNQDHLLDMSEFREVALSNPLVMHVFKLNDSQL